MHERGQNQTVRHLNEAAEEGRDALRPPQTHSWAGQATITWAMWCK
jgi:hypothetical protein